jgi:outer membrane protein assembly factor BamB
MKRSVIFCILCLTVFAYSCSKTEVVSPKAKETELKATVSFLVGDVKIDTTGVMSDARVNMEIGKGNAIVTGKKSECNLLIGEDSYVLVRENSRLVIDKLVKSVEGLETNSVDLKMGKIVVNPKKLLKSEEFKVKTPTAIAAVRGTKFVVSQEEGKAVHVSVVEGKVEMKPRVAALDDAEVKSQDQVVVNQIRKKVDESIIVIEENQSATLDTRSVETLNRSVEKAIEAAASIPEVKDTANKPVPDIAKIDAIANIVSTATVVMEKIDKSAVEEVKQQDRMIENEKRSQENKSKPTASLTIKSPVKDSIISVGGKVIGRSNVSLKVDADISVKVEIATRDFEKYTEEVILKKDESKIIEPALIRTKLRERIDWNAKVGNIRSDLLFYGRSIIAATSDGNLVSMNHAGAQIWNIRLGGGIDATPSVSDGKIYVVTKNEILYSVDVETGKILWTAKTGGALVFGASPCVVDRNIIVAASNGKVLSFSPDGKDLWVTDIGSGIYSSPTVSDGIIYVGADDQKLYAISSKKGNIEWKAKLDGRVVSSSPVVRDGKIYIGTFKGTLYALGVKKGKTEWTASTGGPIVSSPVFDGMKLYIGSKDGKLYALDASSGKEIWSYKSASPITAEVAFNGTQIYLLSGRIVYALNPANGEMIWSCPVAGTGTSIIADKNQVFVATSTGLANLRVDLKDVVK